MVEQFDSLSEKMIGTLQKSLRLIRQSLKLGVQEFADLIGVTRQTVNNLESQKSQMSVTQFVAICSAIDHYTSKSSQLRQIIYQFLQLDNDADNVFLHIDSSANIPLSKRWFALFEDDVEDGGFNEISWKSLAFTGNEAVCDFKYLAENCRIFADDTALSHPLFERASKPLLDLLKGNGKTIIVPYRVVEIVCGRGEYELRSETGTHCLKQMKQRGILDVRGEKNDGNAANTLVSVFARFKSKYKLALFTQSKKLANQILNLNKTAMEGFDILVYFLDKNGEFRPWDTYDGLFDADCLNDFNDPEMPMDDNADGLFGWDTI
ncbi:MAG: helix-turn-helix domain-containing protein [Prevotella sp.]|nr:helix-turn-helix domain-containing protein [Prevotella sp.]